MPLELKEVTSHVVDVYEGVFLMDVVLCYVDVEVVEAVLVKSRLLAPWSNVARHRI